MLASTGSPPGRACSAASIRSAGRASRKDRRARPTHGGSPGCAPRSAGTTPARWVGVSPGTWPGHGMRKAGPPCGPAFLYRDLAMQNPALRRGSAPLDLEPNVGQVEGALDRAALQQLDA